VIKIQINNRKLDVPSGSTVATAVFASEAVSFRESVSGEKRFPICGMGICFECRVSINGVKHRRSCQILVKEGMKIETDG